MEFRRGQRSCLQIISFNLLSFHSLHFEDVEVELFFCMGQRSFWNSLDFWIHLLAELVFQSFSCIDVGLLISFLHDDVQVG